MSRLSIKAAYTVPELGRMMGLNRHRARRVLNRMRVPITDGVPALVFLADLKDLAPTIWRSLEEAAHLRGLAGDDDLPRVAGGQPADRSGSCGDHTHNCHHMRTRPRCPERQTRTLMLRIQLFLSAFFSLAVELLRTMIETLCALAEVLWGTKRPPPPAVPKTLQLGRVDRVRLDGTVDVRFDDPSLAPAQRVKLRGAADVEPGELVVVMSGGIGDPRPVAWVPEIEGSPAPATRLEVN